MTKQEIYQNSFIYLLYRITPSLRYLFLDIQRDSRKKIIIIAYFEREPSDLEKEIIDDIGTNIIAMIDEIFELEIKLVATNQNYQFLDKTDYLLFARFEEGVAY